MNKKHSGKKGFLEISFGWLFAIIVGAFILFLAIYLAVRLIDLESTSQNVEASKEIGVLLNPLETSFQESTATVLGMGDEARIYTTCAEFGLFGEQRIRVARKNFGGWKDTGISVSLENKFIFSESPVEGGNFFLFSKPLEMPFKVTDLTYLIPTDAEYCFVNPPSEISSDVESLNLNINSSERLSACPQNSVTVCFDGGDCDVDVNMQSKTVRKDSLVYFEGEALMYAAIFSSSGDYECQLTRIMKRVSSLSDIYIEKQTIIARENCNSNLDLSLIRNQAESFGDSSDLERFFTVSEEIFNQNRRADCRIW